MTYQDQWSHGKLVKRGTRECAGRYSVIKTACLDLRPDFMACDIGANMCYFGIRLTEDFPRCRVMAFERDHFEKRAEHLRTSGADRVALMRQHVTLSGVAALSDSITFDVVLALSVLHHVPGKVEDWLDALRRLGRRVLVEFASLDSPRAMSRGACKIPPDGVVIGYGKSHLRKGFDRPIVFLPGRA